MSLAVRFQGIEKQFGPVRVLHGVSFDLAPGRIYGLLGENGAGKSTLMKILAGYERANAGELFVDERARDFASSRDAEHAGIVLIHQELNLADHLSITQNMFLGHELKKGFFLDEAAMRDDARAALNDVGLHKNPDTKVRDLIVAEKQLVEIAKAMLRSARLLIMDEPTATLTPSETQRLFGLMARLKEAGTTIVYISHKLDEVERVTDEVIVMRDGRFVARAPTDELTRQQMANLMVGREVSDMFSDKPHLPDDAPVAFEVEGASVPGWADGIGFSVRKGEVFGFAGLVGAGRTELFEALVGLRPLCAGRVVIDGKTVKLKGPREAMQQGLTYLSEDRKGRGLHVDMALKDNLTMMTLERYAHPLIDTRAHAVGRQSAEARAREVPESRSARDRARRTHARRRCRRETRYLFPDSSAGRGRPRGDRDLVRTDRADRLVSSRRGDARGRTRRDTRHGSFDRREVDRACDRHTLKTPKARAVSPPSRASCSASGRSSG